MTVEDEDDDGAGEPRKDSQHARDVIVAAVCAAFLLSAAEIAEISEAICAARLTAAEAAYYAAAKSAGASNPIWNPPDSLLQQLADTANANARSIAATYGQDMHHEAQSFLDDYAKSHDETLDGAQEALQNDLAQWATERADWKAEQIAQYESSAGQDTGTDAAIDDVFDGTLTDEDGNILDYSQLTVAILPEDSSSDFCSDYAGNTYAFDDAPQIDWPAHVGCMHYAVVLGPDDTEIDLDI